MTMVGYGDTEKFLAEEDTAQIVSAAADEIAGESRSILVIIPDHTRSCPLGQIVRMLHAALAGRVERLDFLIALGTHPPLSEEQIDQLLDIEPGRRSDILPGSMVFNHRWSDEKSLTKIGTLKATQVEQITDGLFAMDIDVTINRLIFDYDVVMIAGPVFPHEVVGFSGGSKYFFPGICGHELLNFFHWLGAMITSPKIIGVKHTPVRAILEAAAEMIRLETCALCMVVRDDRLAGLYFGEVRQAWSAAADLSEKMHVIGVDKAFESVLSCAPRMYDDLWTGGKCMYKLEGIVADGGELIIYAPHIREISATHGEIIEKTGYHTRDYFLTQWEKFKHYPWGVLAHCSHVRGVGTYENGVEKPRINVTLATAISEETCRKINLGYRAPESIDVSDWQNHHEQGRLYVPQAGEMLYRLK